MIRAAVLGKPISHSLSPLVHGEIYRNLQLEFDYQRIELDQATAVKFLEKEIRRGWTGFSLTMPLKEVGFSLDLPVDSLAKRTHTINTITPRGAFNTDASGLARVLRNLGVEFSRAFILGNGATARSAVGGLELLGFEGEISIVRRDGAKDALIPKSDRFAMTFSSINNLSRDDLNAESLIISTLPASAQVSISSHLVGFEGTLLDFTYAPWPSTLAGLVSGRVISGLPVLVAQAVDQAAIFAEIEFDLDAMYTKVLSSTVSHLSAM